MDRKEKAIKKAKQLIEEMSDVAHPVSHMEQVLKYSKEIANHETNVDTDILEIAIWWHDVGRIHVDEGHAKKSAEMVNEELNKLGFDSVIIEKVYDAVINHNSSATPKYIEGKILRDADKLDFLNTSRWQNVIDHKQISTIKAAINKIPSIRNHILTLNQSKLIFDKLFKELQKYISTVSDKFFRKYKKQILEMRNIN